MNREKKSSESVEIDLKGEKEIILKIILNVYE